MSEFWSASAQPRNCREQLSANLEADGRQRLDPSRPGAVRTLPTEGPVEAGSRPFPGQLDQPDIGHGQQLSSRRIGLELGLESLIQLETVGRILHVDEIDDDDAAEIAQPELPDDLAHRFEIEGVDGLFQ